MEMILVVGGRASGKTQKAIDQLLLTESCEGHILVYGNSYREAVEFERRFAGQWASMVSRTTSGDNQRSGPSHPHMHRCTPTTEAAWRGVHYTSIVLDSIFLTFAAGMDKDSDELLFHNIVAASTRSQIQNLIVTIDTECFGSAEARSEYYFMIEVGMTPSVLHRLLLYFRGKTIVIDGGPIHNYNPLIMPAETTYSVK